MKDSNRLNSKGIIIIISTLVIFVGCSIAGVLLLGNNNDTPVDAEVSTTLVDGLDANEDEYIMDEVEVTDANGETVTDANGEPVTEQVIYKVIKDKDGNKIIAKVDENGDVILDNKGEPVTIEQTTNANITVNAMLNNKDSKENFIYSVSGNTVTITYTGTGKINGWNFQNLNEGTDYIVISQKDNIIQIQMLNNNISTITVNCNVENPGSASNNQEEPINPEEGEFNGVETELSQKEVVQSMLEVPYLYEGGSYAWGEAVPTASAAHVAIWMAEREGLNTDTFASGTIVLGLFKFYGQTVVNFKNNCNSEKGSAGITYNSNNDSFSIPGKETADHSVSITSIKTYKPSSGASDDHSYYKVTANVSGGKYSKVTAIIEENKLEPSLGYSIKSLQWS